MKAIIVISGFTEKVYEDTGSSRLWSKLFVGFSNEDTFVLFFKWNHDFAATAKLLEQMGVTECLCCAYSWGAGYGLRTFSQSFTGKVRAILCDPVYHSPIFLCRWLAFLDRTIRFPSNVSVIGWFNQKENEPGGDKVKALVMPKEPITLKYLHSRIDDSEEYHNACFKAAREYVGELS